ncbi:MAG TPA: tRNA (N(6)-L-threonylcarbamoyladenosine(37)-C(2))-methylthiotransferase MtaB [Syntrophorhabdaceae bacterium]|nr:tRNA (N(6)-L-threonylcarbamoyladenosine(37)-C(2))-methylthiotransferase MtaB [Syntrophorhabdaceae bacterium]
MKYFIHTTGCKANQWDTHVISENLKKAGLVRGSMAESDYIIINACTLTEGAERDIRRFINRSRRENPSARLVLAGCHGQVFPDRDFGANLVLGHEEKFHIEEFLDRNGIFRSDRGSFSVEKTNIDTLQSGKTRFFLKIQDGCNNFCSYCVVPYARGVPRSRPAEETLRILKHLKQKGVNEVVLTGIEISAYGDTISGMNLKDLLRTIETAETPARIRMSSVDPLYIDEEFIGIVRKSNKIMKSVHIPLQSGSEEILRAMGRRYTPEAIRNTVDGLKSAMPEIGIGLDVITGFPGEDELKFQETLTFLKDLDISYLHVFPFSARAGTKASLMQSMVSDAEKKRRVRALKEIDRLMREKFSRKFVGKQAFIVPESKIYGGKYMRGYTGSYVPVYIPYEKALENRLIEVTIKGIEDGLLMGIAKNVERGA